MATPNEYIFAICININIVECKYATEYNNIIAQQRININIVECKLLFYLFQN